MNNDRRYEHSFIGEAACGAKGKCVGTMLDEFQVESADDCLRSCQDFPGLDNDGDGNPDDYCNVFNFNANLKTCELLDECHYLNKKCASCISGGVQCSTVQGGKRNCKYMTVLNDCLIEKGVCLK